MMESGGVRVSLDTRYTRCTRRVASKRSEWECRVGQSGVSGAHNRRTNSNVSFWPVDNNVSGVRAFLYVPVAGPAACRKRDSRKAIFPGAERGRVAAGLAWWPRLLVVGQIAFRKPREGTRRRKCDDDAGPRR